MKRFHLMMLLASGMLAMEPAAFAQAAGQATPAPAAAPQPATPVVVPTEPGTTSATYGDWVMRCQRVGDGAAAKRLCEVSQTIRPQDGRDPIAEIALGRLPNEKPLHITTLLPPNVSFPSSVVIAAGDKPASGAELQWRRCLPGGCFADALATDDLVKGWRTASGAGRITFKDASGRDIGFPLSFRGLAQALDALDKS